MLKLLTIIGARPQIIKAAALSRAIKCQFINNIVEIIVHTGQHYDENMSQVFFDELEIPSPDYNLNIGSGSHGNQSAQMITAIEKIIFEERPDFIILYGDTNSTLAGAIAASKIHIPIVHIEAGLRSFNRKMPEEINRVVCDHLASFLFSPTLSGYNNLIHEGFNPDNKGAFNADKPGIFHCGDVMYDNSIFFSGIAQGKSKILEKCNVSASEYSLATIHRDYNTDNPTNLASIFSALQDISNTEKIIIPLHPRTLKILKSDQHHQLHNSIKESNNLIVIPPVSFLDMIQLEKNAKMIITDSGGVQKEAYFFNKPCIILRTETEWVEILETGKAILVGSDYEKIITAFKSLSNSKHEVFPSIFGDGKAAEFICYTLLNNNV